MQMLVFRAQETLLLAQAGSLAVLRWLYSAPGPVSRLQIPCENRHSEAEESFDVAKQGTFENKMFSITRVRFSTQSNYYRTY